MNEWMNGRTDGRTDGQTDEQTNEWMLSISEGMYHQELIFSSADSGYGIMLMNSK